MATRYVAFLRGINVGGRNVKKAEFVAPFEAAGFTGVETFIASGNVIAETSSRAKPAALESALERELQAAFGFPVATFLRTDAEVAAVASYDPFPDVDRDDKHTLHVTFLRNAADQALRDALLGAANDEDRFAFAGREFYWLRHGRMTDTTLPPAVVRKLSVNGEGTARNTTTIRKLAAKYPPH
jgi:uncharacterized protein (DUF1697 family)